MSTQTPSAVGLGGVALERGLSAGGGAYQLDTFIF